MRLRLGAAAAGVALIAAAVLGFGLAAHPTWLEAMASAPLQHRLPAGRGALLPAGARPPLRDRPSPGSGSPGCAAQPDRAWRRDRRSAGPARARRDIRRRGGVMTVGSTGQRPSMRIRHAGVCFTNPDRGRDRPRRGDEAVHARGIPAPGRRPLHSSAGQAGRGEVQVAGRDEVPAIRFDQLAV